MSLWQLVLAFGRIGTVGFGGGAGMLALIRETIVGRKHWVDDDQLRVAVAMGQMLPGPFVSNYAEYIGYELRGVRGMLLAVVAMLTPSFVLMCILSWLYGQFGAVPIAVRVFTGVQPVVAGILAWATVGIGRVHVIGWRSAVIAVLAFLALMFRVDVLLVILGSGLLGIAFSGAWRQPAGRGAPAVAPYLVGLVGSVRLGEGAWSRAAELGIVFLKIGTVIFGGGFAAIPFLQHEVVDVRHWLAASEFIDGVALGQMTPGPVAIMATYVGFRVLGLPGALVATVAVFLPSLLMLWGLIHVYRRVKGNPLVRGFLSGVMPAVTGMLLSATLFIARNGISGPVGALVMVLALMLLVRFRLDPVWLVIGGGLLGLVLPA